MAGDHIKPATDDEDPLLTPQERQTRRAAAGLAEESKRLVKKLAALTGPKELLHRFPQRPREPDREPDRGADNGADHGARGAETD